MHHPSWPVDDGPTTHVEDPLELLGYDAARAGEFAALGDPLLEPARVARVDRGLVTVFGRGGAERLPAPAEAPAVGDWVACRPGVTIEAVLERRSALVRRAGDHSRSPTPLDRQVIAANVDVVVVLRALDVGLSASRIQAFLTIAWESGATPLVVLSKADVAADPAAAVLEVERVALGVPVLAVSARTGAGTDELRAHAAQRTIVFLGESGAGKSTLTNLLVGREVLATAEVRRDGAGRHTTTHRELVPVRGGGAIIDTPGVREAGYWGSGAGIARAYGDVDELAATCRFNDCRHESEPGCAIRAALANGALAPERLAAYRHAEREQAFVERKENRSLRAEARGRGRALERARRRDAW